MVETPSPFRGGGGGSGEVANDNGEVRATCGVLRKVAPFGSLTLDLSWGDAS